MRLLATSAVLLAALLGGASAARAVPAPWERRETKPRPFPAILVSVDQLVAQPPGARAVALDARSASRVRLGTLPGALPVPARDLPSDPTRLSMRLRELGVPPRGPIVCFSDRAEPVEAGRLFWLLELAGYENVRVLEGGLEAWRSAGQRIEKPAVVARRVPPASGTTPPPARAERLAGEQDVRAAFGRRGFVLLDWRAESEWEAGHVPYSLAFPFGELGSKAGLAVAPDSIRRRFERFGPRAVELMSLADTVIVFGDLGPADAPLHPYLACRLAGIEHVRNWPDGWSGWLERPGVPIVRVVDTKSVESRVRRPPFWMLHRRNEPAPIVFDVRGEADYRSGHLPGAVSLPSHRFDQDLDSVIAARAPRFDRASTPVILYCYGLSCTRSRNCAALVARRGIARIEWYREGIEGWRAAGLPEEEGSQPTSENPGPAAPAPAPGQTNGPARERGRTRRRCVRRMLSAGTDP